MEPAAEAHARAGRAIGAMFFYGFGGAWLALWAANSFEPPWFALAAIVLATGMLLGFAWRVYRRHHPRGTALPDTPAERQRARRFQWINAAQWIAIFVVANLLSRSGHGRYVLASIVAIVGLHFLPLARLFAYPPHLLTGVAMVGWAVVCSLLPGLGPDSAAMALGAGVVLWASASWALGPGSGAAPRALR